MLMRNLKSSALLIAFFVLFGIQSTAHADQEEQKRQIFDLLKRMDESTSLRWNAMQMLQYAQMPGDDVLPNLLEIYEEPPSCSVENMRYLAANYIRMRYGIGREAASKRVPSESDIAALRAFLKRHSRDASRVWGVSCVASVIAQQGNLELSMELLDILGDKRAPAVIRACILHALECSDFPYTRRALALMLEGDFKKSAEDAVLFEAVCWAAARNYRPLYKVGQPLLEEWRPVMERIVELMEQDRGVPERSKYQACLALQYCFQTKQAYRYPASWKLLFQTGRDPSADDGGKTTANFMGLEVEGERIVFLLDASDSMLNLLSNDDKDALRNPVTQDKRKKKKAEGYEIDWDRVQTRFDAAREHVKWTLSRLTGETQVAVILFGDRAETLSATPCFIQCTKGNVKKIQSTLDTIRPGKAPEQKEATRPRGVLMGETNYYAALLAAFRTSKDGVLQSPREHWDAKLVTEGADAIFLLSDGAPVRDGFAGNTPKLLSGVYSTKQPGDGEWRNVPAIPARPACEIEVRDPETGEITKVEYPAQPAIPEHQVWIKYNDREMRFDNGPYAVSNKRTSWYWEVDNMLDEIERMNLVRRVRINCVGIGEASMDWLGPIARETGGKAAFFGKEETDPTLPKDPPGFPSGD